LIADETSQKPSEGKCIAFGNENSHTALPCGIDFAIADAGDIYDGVHFVRTVALLNANLLVFVDQIRCDSERLLDIAYHNRGVWDTLPNGTAWTPAEKDGYHYLRDTTVRQTSECSTLTARICDNWDIAITLAGGEPTEIITGTGVGAHVEDRVPLVLFRRRAKETALAWCVALDGEAAGIELLTVRDTKGNILDKSIAAAVQVITIDGRRYRFITNPERRSLLVQLPDDAEWLTEAAFAARLRQ
jgi:hypothetical protein